MNRMEELAANEIGRESDHIFTDIIVVNIPLWTGRRWEIFYLTWNFICTDVVALVAQPICHGEPVVKVVINLCLKRLWLR